MTLFGTFILSMSGSRDAFSIYTPMNGITAAIISKDATKRKDGGC